MAKLKIKQMEGIIEAILFTMGDSVEIGKIARALEQDEETTRKVIHKMMDKYVAEDRGVRIIELDGAYQMCTKTEMYEYLIRVASQPKKHVLTDVFTWRHYRSLPISSRLQSLRSKRSVG